MPDLGIVLLGADVIDGTGASPARLDLLLEGERIVAIEPPGVLDGYRGPVIELDGLALAPGFIDVHSHADNAPFLLEDDTSKLLQGVTTEIVGNCGFGLATGVPRAEPAYADLVAQFFPAGTPRFDSWAAYLTEAEAGIPMTNQAFLVGHGALRAAAVGAADRPVTPQEAAVMGNALRTALDAGASGFSTGLIYSPGMFADAAELTELARLLPPGAPYVTHLRGESHQLRASIAEAISIAERAERPLHVSHLKAAGRENWGRMPEILTRLDAARDRGIDVRQDVYPYTAGSTILAALLPPDVRSAGAGGVLNALADPAESARIAARMHTPGEEWENLSAENGWDNIVISSSREDGVVGMSLAAIAARNGQDPAHAALDLLRADALRTGMIVHSMHVDDLAAAVSDPHTMFGSDGLPPGVPGKPHPRLHGTFPRVLARLAREGSTFTLAEAVRRMTGLPASAFGLRGRGVISVGAIADLVAFSPADIRDTATYRDPQRVPQGIAWVMLAGEIVAEQGRFLGRRRGRILRRSA